MRSRVSPDPGSPWEGSPDEAARTARLLVQSLPVGYRAVKGYGDQAYIVDSASSLAMRLIIQKGTTVLSIGSRDAEALLRIAPRMVKEVEQAQREGVVR